MFTNRVLKFKKQIKLISYMLFYFQDKQIMDLKQNSVLSVFLISEPMPDVEDKFIYEDVNHLGCVLYNSWFCW